MPYFRNCAAAAVCPVHAETKVKFQTIPHVLRGACKHSAIVSLKVSIPARIPILYVILGVLVAISVVPMYFYSAHVESNNRERLKTNEMLLQNTVTRSLADDISQHEASLRLMLGNLSSAIQIASGGDIGAA